MDPDKAVIIAPVGKSIGHPLERRARKPMSGFSGISQSRASIDSELRIPIPATALVVLAMLTAQEKQAFEEHVAAARDLYDAALQRMSVSAGARHQEHVPAAQQPEPEPATSEVESARISAEPEPEPEPEPEEKGDGAGAGDPSHQPPTTTPTTETDESTARESDGTERNSDPSEHPDEVRPQTEPGEGTEPVQVDGTDTDAQGAVTGTDTDTDNAAVQAALIAAMGASASESETTTPPTTITNDDPNKPDNRPRRQRRS